jgi:hypothetical protein
LAAAGCKTPADTEKEASMLVRILAISSLWLFCSTSFAEETVDIPLYQIWAWDMPGTQNISDLEKATPSEDWLITKIRDEQHSKGWMAKAGRAFAVEGTGLKALENAHDVIFGKQKRLTSLSGEISVIFFSLAGGQYVHLTKVEREGDTINIRYKLVPHEQKHLTRHFAIIPLGKLPKGNYKVDIATKSPAKPSVTLPRVSASFDFTVE